MTRPRLRAWLAALAFSGAVALPPAAAQNLGALPQRPAPRAAAAPPPGGTLQAPDLAANHRRLVQRRRAEEAQQQRFLLMAPALRRPDAGR